MASSTATRKVGDVVGVSDPKFPGRWTVVKVNPTTYKLEQPGRRLTAHHAFVTDAPAESETVDIPEPFSPGEIVRARRSQRMGDHLYVVLQDRLDKVKVARLGGDAGRYWTVPAGVLDRVDPATVLKTS